MALFSLKEIQERRAELLDECEAILAVCKEENREPNADESAKIEANMAECDALEPQEVTARKLDSHKAKAAASRSAGPQASVEGPHGNQQEKPKVYATPSRPLRAFRGKDAGQHAYDSGMWLKAILGGDMDARRHCADRGIGGIRADAQTADDFAKGGLFVPHEMSNAIIRVVSEVGIADRLADVVPMTTETMDVPRRSSGPTVYYPGEVEEVTSSEASWNRVGLTVKDRAVMTRISHKLMRSSAVSLAERVAEEMGYAFALKKDEEFINGDGTSTYGGEIGLRTAIGSAGVNQTATTSGDTWAELALSDFTNTMALLPSKWWRSPAWVCSAPFYHSVMLRLMAAAGGNAIGDIENGANARFLGYPVYFTDRMPTATAVSTVHCLFGSFMDAAMIGQRESITLDTSNQRYFETREIAILGQTAYDINVYEGGDASNAGAYVALKTGAAS